MPPVAPKITYRNGLLEIEAPNCTLGDILNGIRGKTGIQFEGVGSAPDRVATSLGPAPADEVLTSLLFGSRFDFLIVNQVDNPETVQRVVLTPHAGTSAPPSAFVENRGVPATSNNEDEEGGSEDPDAESAVAPPAQGGAAPKTTQQLLQELQQLQKEQQQQQQPNQGRQPAPLKPPKAGFPQL